MFERILVPLDGSPLAERAVPVAARLARASGGTLIFLRVYQPIIGDATVLPPPDGMGADEREARTYLAHMATREDLAGITHETAALGGAPAPNILDATRVYRADGIVMTSHGRSGLGRYLLGGVAAQVVHHADAPVLILRDAGLPLRPSVGEERVVWSALVALDGSARAEAALEPATHVLCALAGDEPAELRLLRAIAPAREAVAATAEPSASTRGASDEPRSAGAYLSSVANRLRGAPPTACPRAIAWSVVTAADVSLAAVARAVIDVAERPATHAWWSVRGTGANGPGGGGMAGTEVSRPSTEPAAIGAAERFAPTTLIALATHGRSGLERWRLGSTAEHILHGTTQPVLLVRSPAAGRRPSSGDE